MEAEVVEDSFDDLVVGELERRLAISAEGHAQDLPSVRRLPVPPLLGAERGGGHRPLHRLGDEIPTSSREPIGPFAFIDMQSDHDDVGRFGSAERGRCLGSYRGQQRGCDRSRCGQDHRTEVLIVDVPASSSCGDRPDRVAQLKRAASCNHGVCSRAGQIGDTTAWCCENRCGCSGGCAGSLS